MASDTTGIAATQTRWYRSGTRVHRPAGRNSGWLFDGSETRTLMLAVGPAAPRVNGREATSRPQENPGRSWRHQLSCGHVDHIACVY